MICRQEAYERTGQVVRSQPPIIRRYTCPTRSEKSSAPLDLCQRYISHGGTPLPYCMTILSQASNTPKDPIQGTVRVYMCHRFCQYLLTFKQKENPGVSSQKVTSHQGETVYSGRSETVSASAARYKPRKASKEMGGAQQGPRVGPIGQRSYLPNPAPRVTPGSGRRRIWWRSKVPEVTAGITPPTVDPGKLRRTNRRIGFDPSAPPSGQMPPSPWSNGAYSMCVPVAVVFLVPVAFFLEFSKLMAFGPRILKSSFIVHLSFDIVKILLPVEFGCSQWS